MLPINPPIRKEIVGLYQCQVGRIPYRIKLEDGEIPGNTVDLQLAFTQAQACQIRVRFFEDQELLAVVNTHSTKSLFRQAISIGHVPTATHIELSATSDLDDVFVERVTLSTKRTPLNLIVKGHLLGLGEELRQNKVRLLGGQLCFVTETPAQRLYSIHAHGQVSFSHEATAQVTLDGAAWITQSDKAIGRCIASDDAVVTVAIMEY